MRSSQFKPDSFKPDQGHKLTWSRLLPATSMPLTSRTSSLAASKPVLSASPPGTRRDMNTPATRSRLPDEVGWMEKPSLTKNPKGFCVLLRISFTLRCVGGKMSASMIAETYLWWWCGGGGGGSVVKVVVLVWWMCSWWWCWFG